MNSIVFDVESYPIDGAADYLEPATAPDNYKDPTKIAAYIEKANADALAKAALDVDLARIVALGIDTGNGPVVSVCRNEEEEREALVAFWLLLLPQPRPTLVGFNCIGFDLPLLLRRSLYLGIPTVRLPINKYRHDGIVDLMLALSFDGALKYRSLAFYTKRFDLPVDVDPTTGADIAALVKAEAWEEVAAHCRCDLSATKALAERMGVL